MIPDPNDEILANKRRLAAKFDNDLHRIAEDIRRRQNDDGSEVVSLPPRRYVPNSTAAQTTEAAISVAPDSKSLEAILGTEL